MSVLPPRRKHPRLTEYDYSQSGCYFVTVQTWKNQQFLSTLPVGRGLVPAVYSDPRETPGTCLTSMGEIAVKQLLALEERYSNVKVDKYVVMPTHIHMILRITEEAAGASPRPTLMDAVGAFKSLTTRACNAADGVSGRKIFQTSFYEHVIRNAESYREIWTYIDENPRRWEEKRRNSR